MKAGTKQSAVTKALVTEALHNFKFASVEWDVRTKSPLFYEAVLRMCYVLGQEIAQLPRNEQAGGLQYSQDILNRWVDSMVSSVVKEADTRLSPETNIVADTTCYICLREFDADELRDCKCGAHCCALCYYIHGCNDAEWHALVPETHPAEQQKNVKDLVQRMRTGGING